MNLTQAYVNHGRWVADCGRQYCASAEKLLPGQEFFHCSDCHWEGLIEWPRNASAIWAILLKRPVPTTRNWFPKNHELALRSGALHGQTVLDLINENQEYGVD